MSNCKPLGYVIARDWELHAMKEILLGLWAEIKGGVASVWVPDGDEDLGIFGKLVAIISQVFAALVIIPIVLYVLLWLVLGFWGMAGRYVS